MFTLSNFCKKCQINIFWDRWTTVHWRRYYWSAKMLMWFVLNFNTIYFIHCVLTMGFCFLSPSSLLCWLAIPTVIGHIVVIKEIPHGIMHALHLVRGVCYKMAVLNSLGIASGYKILLLSSWDIRNQAMKNLIILSLKHAAGQPSHHLMALTILNKSIIQ